MRAPRAKPFRKLPRQGRIRIAALTQRHHYFGGSTLVFHAATASASVAQTRVATVSHFLQNTCHPGADLEGLSISALLAQNGHFRRSATKEAYQDSCVLRGILASRVPVRTEPALICVMTQLSDDAVRMFWLSIGNLV